MGAIVGDAGINKLERQQTNTKKIDLT